MMQGILLNIAIILHIQTQGIYCEYDYCTKPCGKTPHTICEVGNPCPISSKCKSTDTPFQYVTDGEKEFILDLHNKLRNMLAAGEEERGGFSGVKASNMQILSWRKEVELISACNTKRCASHDKCRGMFDGTSCGQNIFGISSSAGLKKKNFHEDSFFNRSIYSWYHEIGRCGCDHTKFTSAVSSTNGKVIAHFTAVIWGKVKYIGCSKMAFTVQGKGKGHSITTGCNYCPAPNIRNTAYFETGEPGPDCGQDSRYPALCGKQIDLKDDTYILTAADSLKNSPLAAFIFLTAVFNIIL